MRHIHILCIASEHIFTEAISIFKSYFESKGCFVSYEYAFKVSPKQPFSEDMNIIIKAQRHFDPDTLPNWSCKVLFQTEQYAKLREFGSMPHSKKWDLILDVFQDNCDKVAATSPANVVFFPIGYDSEYQFTDKISLKQWSPDCQQNCYFFGARTRYRVDLWNKHVKGKVLASRFANTDYEITKYMNILRSKVNIFMPAWEPYYVPTMHIMQVLANKKFLLVVSDTSQDFHPYRAGRHFALTSSKEFGTMLKRYIDADNFRRDFEQKMYEDIKTDYKFIDYLNGALKGYI